MIACEYRNHAAVWLRVEFIESIGEAKNGSVVRMTSGTIHDVLDSPDQIIERVMSALGAIGSYFASHE